jgi:hypothetical protein
MYQCRAEGYVKNGVYELIDKCLSRATCILKNICACFLTGSLKNNRAFPERLLNDQSWIGDRGPSAKQII